VSHARNIMQTTNPLELALHTSERAFSGSGRWSKPVF
jgi:hypothetical protein